MPTKPGAASADQHRQEAQTCILETTSLLFGWFGGVAEGTINSRSQLAATLGEPAGV